MTTKYWIKGPQITTGTACSAGLNAITDAYLYIRNNLTESFFVGASEEMLDPLIINGV